MNAFFTKEGIRRHFRAMAETAQAMLGFLDARQGPNNRVDLLDFTRRATAHAILLAVFSHRSDLFLGGRRDDAIVDGTSFALEEFVRQTYYPKLVLKFRGTKRLDESIEAVRGRVKALLRERVESGEKKDDILQQMLDAGFDANDPAEFLIDQLVILLVAGFETSASTLASGFDLLATHPKTCADIRNEVAATPFDDDNAAEQWSVDDVSSLGLCERVIHETLRVDPVVPLFLRIARHDVEVISSTNGESYRIRKGDIVSIVSSALHRNAAQFEDPLSFRPDRFLTSKHHPYAFLPFGAGMRGCLGRLFATQELKLFVAIVVSRFDFTRVEARFKRRKDVYGVTRSPENAFVHVKRRPRKATSSQGCAVVELQKETNKWTDMAQVDQSSRSGSTTSASNASSQSLSNFNSSAMSSSSRIGDEAANLKTRGNTGCKLVLAYGSGLGECRSLSYGLSEQLAEVGLPSVVCTLDDLIDFDASEDIVIACITSTYNGEPPPTAERFHRWLTAEKTSTERRKRHLWRFAVFGLGSSEWRATLHQFPRTTHQGLSMLGCQPLLPLRTADVEARGNDVELAWSQWACDLAQAIIKHRHLQLDAGPDNFQLASSREIEVSLDNNPDVSSPKKTLDEIEVTSIAPLSRRALCVGLKRIGTPQPGDHVELWPRNSAVTVAFLKERLGMEGHEVLRTTSTKRIPSSLAAFSISGCTTNEALTHLLDLGCRPSSSVIAGLSARARARGDVKSAEALVRRLEGGVCRTMLDLFVAVQDAVPNLTWRDWLAVWPAAKRRLYSIAELSSSAEQLGEANIYVSVDEEFGQIGKFLLHSEATGLKLRGKLHPNPDFRPSKQGSIVMIATGTGLGPFMGFLNETRVRGQKAELVFGCRDDTNFLRKRVLEQMVQDGSIARVSLKCTCRRSCCH